MASIYKPIWDQIRELPTPKDEVVVRVHDRAVKTLIQAVRKQKTEEVAVKKKVGMKVPGALIVHPKKSDDPKDKDFTYIHFSLQFSWKWV